ncbi:50S ribosomal protein L2, partial [Candidatus Woesearchaeota archaeon]|nr:50S ribosomal protein L2 [Candidatus Woesearchaeota archaeon]
MGTPLIHQRRGKGTPTYRAPSHRYHGKVKYAQITGKAMRGEVIDIVNSIGHSAPLMEIKYENGNKALLPAPLGIKIGDEIWIGDGAKPTKGSTIKLNDIPTGTFIFNIEKRPFDGGQLVRTSGGAAQVIG